MKSVKILVLVSLLLEASCASNNEKPATQPEPAAAPKPDSSILGPVAAPADNPVTPEKAELGKKLFFDTRLSKTGNMSCETCHLPEKGWTDGKTLSTRFDGSM